MVVMAAVQGMLLKVPQEDKEERKNSHSDTPQDSPSVTVGKKRRAGTFEKPDRQTAVCEVCDIPWQKLPRIMQIMHKY